jgi:hypothetical protein
MSAKRTELNNRLEHVVAIHFDAKWGTPYWLEQQDQLGIDAIKDVRSIEDLAVLGPMDEDALAQRPVEDFVPRRFSDCRDYLLVETGGTLGPSKFAVHRRDEFETAFITPFVKAAERVNFPKDGHWLFVGPTGPHVIGRAARGCAAAFGAADVFTVDFDPRWAKKLPGGSFAAKRYLSHIEAQALHVLEAQAITVIFTTPAVLIGLAKQLGEAKREAIRGIHLGGMSASAEFMDETSVLFPQAVVLSGYGNTLLGMMPQLHYASETGFDYYAYGDRLAAQLIPLPESDETPNVAARVDYRQRGQVMVHRLDEMQFLANLIERDSAIRIKPDPGARADGFLQDGLRDPQAIVNEVLKPAVGLY